jgi:hypothetical protein
MKRAERIMEALRSHHMKDDSIESLLATAYWMGREAEAKILGDKMSKHIASQRKRAKDCRYHKMAESVVGTEQFIYSPNYEPLMTNEFGNDETKI